MKYRLFMAIALLIGAMGCSVDSLVVEQEDSLKIVFEAAPFLDGDRASDTRTSVIPNESYSSYQFIWSAKDTVGIYPDAGSQVYFTMENGAGASSASFDGGAWTCKEGHEYRSYFPFIGDIYLDKTKIPVSFVGQKQVGNDNSDHFQEFDYMYAPVATKVNGSLNFSYHHLITGVLPWVELPAGHYTGLTLSLDEALFVTEGKYDLTAESPAIIGTKYSDSMSIELDVTFDSPDILKVYIPLAPMDMSGKTLTITITDEDEREFQYTYNPSKPYVASKIYRLRSAISFVPQNNVIYYTSTDGSIVTPYKTDVFGANIVDNKYIDGQGIITFDGDVTSIGAAAFRSCQTLATMTLPKSVSSFGNAAFSTCTNLLSINVPNGVTTIPFNSFAGCSNLTSIILPEGVSTIASQAFYNCSSLATVDLPESLNTIGSGAFKCCTNLTSITLPETIIDIGVDAFYGCTSLISISIPNGVTIISGEVFANCSSLSAVVIPNSVTEIGASAFSGCSSLVSILIPSGITFIGHEAFKECSMLTSVSLPERLTSIEKGLFYGCTSLASITIPNSVLNIKNEAFYYCKSLTSISIPQGVSAIGEMAFCGCTNLTSISMPETASSIGLACFMSCESLTSIVIPEGVLSIERQTFFHCYNLTSITIPESVTGIGNHAFYGCTSLTSLSIPKYVSTLGAQLFGQNNSLESVVLQSPLPPSFDNTVVSPFSETHCLFYVPKESLETYKTDQLWSGYANRILAIGTPIAVDLGLPSGIKWASFNLGALAPEEYGDYYAWGETKPYYSGIDPLSWEEGKEEGYWWSSYKWCMGSGTTMTKYCDNSSYGYNGFTDNKTVIDLEDDAAHANLGGNWRMPTKTEWMELKENCNWTWITQNGVCGRLVTASNGNSIFLPAAGFRSSLLITDAGSNGSYWSSSLITDYPCLGLYWDFDSGWVSNGGSSGRHFGYSIRPVSE